MTLRHKNIYRYFHAILVFCAVMVLIIRGASASETEIRAFAQDLSKNLVTNFNKPAIKTIERQQVLRDYLQRYIDLDYVAKFVLGNYRRGLPEDKMTAFRTVLAENIVGTYAHWLKDIPIANFTIGRIIEGNRQNWYVESQFRDPQKKQAIGLQWRVRKVGSDWRIRDVQIEGISMIVTQRDSFVNFIRSNGGNVEKLISTLKQKNSKLLASS